MNKEKKRRAVIFNFPSCLFHDNSLKKSRQTNTCFFSSLIQILTRTKSLSDTSSGMSFTFMPQWIKWFIGTEIPLPKSVILRQGRSVTVTRWTQRCHTNTSRAQDSGTLHSLQETAALYCGMFWDLVASSSMLHIKMQVNGLNKPVKKDKKTSVSGRVFPYRPHLRVRRIISIFMKMNAISSTVSVLSCF